MIKKRIVRMRGSIRAYIRMHHFNNFVKIQKAARVMNVINKTMFRCLRRVRYRLNAKAREAEQARLLADEKYQRALQATKELERMRAEQAKMTMKFKDLQVN